MSCGWKATIAASAWGKIFEARCWTTGIVASSSWVSLCFPGRSSARLRLRVKGMNLLSTGRSSARKGARFLVAGLAVLISGSTSSSAARRLTKVVLAWRSTGGSSCSD